MIEKDIFKKIINFLDYIFDKLIAGNLKRLFHFLVNEVMEKIIIRLLDKCIEISVLTSMYILYKTIAIAHADLGECIIVACHSLLVVISYYTGGNVLAYIQEIKKMTDNFTKKNEKP